MDLGSCELAVLSACETNVGYRRAGEGIHSLQAALHAAGRAHGRDLPLASARRGYAGS